MRKCFQNTFAILTGFAHGVGFDMFLVFESTGGEYQEMRNECAGQCRQLRMRRLAIASGSLQRLVRSSVCIKTVSKNTSDLISRCNGITRKKHPVLVRVR